MPNCSTSAAHRHLALLVWRPDLKITGLEPQDGPLDLFRQSITANELENVNRSAGRPPADALPLLPHGSMDYVICNPPYFDRNAGANAPTAEKRTARLDATCSVEELAVAALPSCWALPRQSRVRIPAGTAVGAARSALRACGSKRKRMRFVHQKRAGGAKRRHGRVPKGGSAEGLVVEPPLIVESDEYFRIYGIEH